MAKLPIYEQQTRAESPQMSAADAGAGIGDALYQTGASLTEIGGMMQRREDVIDRVRLMNEFDLNAAQMFEGIQSGEDMTSAATVDKYYSGLREKMDNIIGQHRGSSSSRAELRSHIENQLGQYHKGAVSAQIKAQHTMLATTVDQITNQLSSQTSVAPDQMLNALTLFDSQLNQYAPALSQSQSEQYRNNGRAKIISSTVTGFLSRGNYTQAKALMADPEVVKFMSPEVSSRFHLDIAVDERKSEVKLEEQNRMVRSFASTLKRDLTPDEVARIRDLPVDRKNMTPTDQIIELELVTGRPATPEQVAKIMGVAAASGGAFGDSMKGRSISYVNDNALAYATGVLTPDQARQFEASFTEAYAPLDKQDPATGLWTKIVPAVPRQAQEAMSRGQRFYSLGGGVSPQSQQPQQPRPGDTVQLDINGQRIGQGRVDAAGNWTIPAPAEAAAPAPAPAPAQPIPSDAAAQRSIWDRRGNIAGPVAGITAGLQRVPGIGPVATDTFLNSEQVRQADEDRAFVENASRDLVRVLQNNPKFSEGERKSIEKEISIGPEFFRSKESYEGRLVGISQALTERKKAAQQSLAANVSIEERKRAMDTINAIDSFQKQLGIPQVVTTEAEVKLLPPGTRFMDPKGREYTKN